MNTATTTPTAPLLPAHVSSDYLDKGSKDFAIYVARRRAIPDVRDGLKTAQRQALFVMMNKSPSAEVNVNAAVGEMMSRNLYYHGDAAGAETINQMTAYFLNNVPLFEGVGAFGDRAYPKNFSAPRYVAIKRGKAAEMLIYPDKELINYVDNYDGSEQEPECFLPIIPTVLLNGQRGIAVGWATHILPRNINTLIKAVIEAIDGKPVEPIIPHFDYMDVDIYDVGEGKWEIWGKVEKIDSMVCRIKSLTYDMDLEKLKANVLEPLKEDADSIVIDYDDNTADEIDIIVRCKRGTLANKSEADLVEFFGLKKKMTENFTVLGFDGTSIKYPQYENAADIVKEWVDWRFGFYIKRFERLLRLAQHDLAFNELYKACLDAGLPSMLSGIASKTALKTKIEEIADAASIPKIEEHIEKLAVLPTYRWTQEERGKIDTRIKELQDMITDYEDHLANPKKIKKVWKKELKALFEANLTENAKRGE